VTSEVERLIHFVLLVQAWEEEAAQSSTQGGGEGLSPSQKWSSAAKLLGTHGDIEAMDKCVQYEVGQNRIYTPFIHRIRGNFPAKNAIRIPYVRIYVWLWPTLVKYFL
jgi:hypothetical protein